MKNSEIDLILFDLDGTLVNSAPDLAVAVNKTLLDLQHAPHHENQIESWVGNGARALIERALGGIRDSNTKADTELLDRAMPIFFNYYATALAVKTHLYDGVEETLTVLKNSGYKMAVVTNKPERFILPILTALNISEFFELSVGGDTLSTKKPDPYPLLYACEKLGVPVSRCVMVGDSKNDILAARSAKMRSLGVSYGYNYGENIRLYDPEWVVDKFNDILGFITH